MKGGRKEKTVLMVTYHEVRNGKESAVDESTRGVSTRFWQTSQGFTS